MAVAVNPALVAPAAIVTDAGTVTELLLLVRATVVALLAAEVSDTVHASVPAPVSVPPLHETELSAAAVCTGVSVRAKVLESPPARAVKITVRGELTAATVAVKAALVDPAAMTTEAGTLTALLLLVNAIVVALLIE